MKTQDDWIQRQVDIVENAAKEWPEWRVKEAARQFGPLVAANEPREARPIAAEPRNNKHTGEPF